MVYVLYRFRCLEDHFKHTHTHKKKTARRDDALPLKLNPACHVLGRKTILKWRVKKGIFLI